VNAIFGMGLVGGPLVLWLVYRALLRKHPPPAAPQSVRRKQPPGRVRKAGKALGYAAGTPTEGNFWLALIAGGVLLGIAVVGELDPLGVAHLTLLALQVLGLSMLAAVIPWRRRSLAILLLAGCTVDFSLGVLLQARVESLDNTAHSRVFPEMDFVGGQIQNTPPGPGTLSYAAWQNWYYKHRLTLHTRWLGELRERHGDEPAFQKILPKLTAQLANLQAEDATTWQGWFGRHGGEIEFLGDRVANRFGPMKAVGTALLLALFVGLAGGVILRTR
jgi:hypothetical protein